VSAQYLVSIERISRMSGCMSPGFTAKGYGLATHSTRLL